VTGGATRSQPGGVGWDPQGSESPDDYGQAVARRNRAADVFRLILWTILPILGAAAVSILAGAAAVVEKAPAAVLRGWALWIAIGLAILVVAKAIRDYRWGRSLTQARYDAVKELQNRLGPALDLMTELAVIDPSENAARIANLRVIAQQCCSALVAMTPGVPNVRAVVFALMSGPDRLEAIGRFGRNDVPRIFHLSTPVGTEIMAYLEANPPIGAELYPDVSKEAPEGYEGRRNKYGTFIRVPIWSNGVVFGMLVVDAEKPNSLVDGDKQLAELVASLLATAFATVAP